MFRGLPLLIAFFVVVGVTSGAYAQESLPGSFFTIVPETGDIPTVTEKGYFVYELAPGSKTESSVRLQNESTSPITIEMAAVDATTAQGGGGSYGAADAIPTHAGTWLKLETPRVSLDPGEQTSVGFTVELPETVDPGQYLAGIAAYIPATQALPIATTGANETGASIIVQPRSIVSVQFDVTGDWIPSLAITGARAEEYESGTQLGISLRNTGDTFLQPAGSVTLSNGSATPIVTKTIKLGTFLPGTDLTHLVAWPVVPEGGQYAVDVELNYADDKVATYRGIFNVSDNAPAAQPAPGAEPQPAVQPAAAPVAPSFLQPWMIFTFIGLLLLMVVLLIVLLLRGRRNSSTW